VERQAVTTESGRNYHEVQYSTQIWVWGVVWLIAAIAWYAFIQQIVRGNPVGNHAAPDWIVWIIFLACGICLPALAWWLRLETSVDSHGIAVRFRPLCGCFIALDGLQSCERHRYRPLLDYGGWGIRWTPWRGWAYCVSGNLGIQCVLKNGKRILIGTQKPAALFDAIQAQLSRSADDERTRRAASLSPPNSD